MKYEEELKQPLMDCCVVVTDALDELIRKLQESIQTYEMLSETHDVRTPVEIKKDIRREKNPMRLKQLNKELNDAYKSRIGRKR